MSHNNAPLLDLLVIGAGPAGLSAAVAAVQRGATRVLVVEQSRTLREIGRNLDLMPNQIRALSALSPDVSSLLSPHFLPKEESDVPFAVTVEADGTLLQETKRQHADERLASLPWWKLQRVLLDALSTANSTNSRKFLMLNHQLVSLSQDEHDDCVVAEFVHDRQRENVFRNWNLSEPAGEDESTRYAIPIDEAHREFFSHVPERDDRPGRFVKCRARIVVGADGVNSVARRCIYNQINPAWLPFAEPQYTTLFTAFLKGASDMSDEEKGQLDQEYMHNNSTYCMLTHRKKLPHNTPHRRRHFRAGFFNSRVLTTFCYASLTASTDEATLQASTKRELMEAAIDNAKQAGVTPLFHKYCRGIADRLSDSQVVVRPFFVVPADHPAPFDDLPDMPSHPSYPADFRRPWFHKRVVLIGDAVHAAPNFSGQGAGMAVEDAYELVLQLIKRDLLSSQPSRDSDDDLALITVAFEEFRKGRLERNCRHQRLVMNRPHDEEEAERVTRSLWDYFPEEVSRST